MGTGVLGCSIGGADLVEWLSLHLFTGSITGLLKLVPAKAGIGLYPATVMPAKFVLDSDRGAGIQLIRLSLLRSCGKTAQKMEKRMESSTDRREKIRIVVLVCRDMPIDWIPAFAAMTL